MATDADVLLRVDDVRVEFPSRGWRLAPRPSLRGVSIDVRAGETVGLVGESGAGKSTLGRAVLGLTPIRSGSIHLDGVSVGGVPPRRRPPGLGIQAVFQNPYSSLHPAMTIEEILTEPLIAHRRMPRADAREHVHDLLDRVGLASDAATRMPREFSGGQRQRIAIARALALSPRLIVCDEPVSALDLSTQSRILDLFAEIQDAMGVAYLFISHDLAVIGRISHRVAVLHEGSIVEFSDTDTVTKHPTHSYTKRLLLAAPVADPVRQRERRERRRALRDREEI